MSTSHSPMDLIDRYLQAVNFWLPKTRRQEDVLAELGEDLRSQMEAREEELGRPIDPHEAAEILKRCGAPMVVASRLGPRQSLIGPALYPVYIFVLRMVLLYILVPVFIFIVGPTNLASSNGNWGIAIGNTIGDLWSGLFIAAGIITLVFAIIERSSAHAAIVCKFDPLALPPVRPKHERKMPSLMQTVCQLGFGAFGLMWLLLLPQYPVLILGPAAAYMKAAPMWHVFYVPIVLLSVVSLIRSAITLARPQWEWFPPAAELVQAILSLILLNFILNAVRTPPGSVQMFLVLTDAAKGSMQFIKVAAIVNLSILISLIGAWIGLSIALVVHGWQFLRYLDKRFIRRDHSAPLQVQ